MHHTHPLPSTSFRVDRPQNTKWFKRPGRLNLRRFNRAILCGALVVFFGSALIFSTPSSAAHSGNSWVPISGTSYLRFLAPQIGGAETVETFEADCTTPEDIYILGETVCAVSTNSPAPFNGVRQRRFQWVAPNGLVAKQTDITANPQNDSYTIPTSGAFSQVGTWTVRLIRNSGATQLLTRFTVRDPNNLQTDLSVTKFGPLEVKSGNNVSYSISVINRGPDDALGVSLTDTVPENMTFVSMTQNTGPAFNCTNPSSGGTGTSTCTIANLPRNSTATFTYVAQVSAGAANGTSIFNTVDVSSTTAELNPNDNSSTAPVTVTGAGSGGDECVITCPGDITVDPADGETGAIVTYADPSTIGSNCGAVSCSQASGTFFPIGTTVVVCAAEAGDPCSFTVTVTDDEDPTIDCPDDISVNAPTGATSVSVSYPAPVATDNSGVVTVSCTKASGSNFNVGTTPVTCTATDPVGRTASCTFNVTVVGDGCVLDCPDNIEVNADAGSCSAIVEFTTTASSECGTVTTSHASGSAFPIGVTTVTVSSSGQSCSFTVTVRDDVPPTISCPSDITVPASGSSCAATVNPGTATGSDSCGPVTIVGTRSDGFPITDQTYRVGTTIITWTATDAGGNETSCQQSITVTDSTPPTISVSLPPAVATVVIDENCQALIPGVAPYTTVSDNCTPAANLIIVQSPAAETVVGPGVYTITVTVFEGDPEGAHNSATTTATFTVVDPVPPVLTVNGPNPLVVECHTTLVDPGATATDNCVANPTVTSTNNVNMNVPGNYTITYSTTDGTNTVTATRAVTVVDTTAPVITINGPNPMTVECHTSFTDPGATAFDSCAGNLAVTSTNNVNVNVPGVYSVTYSATDGHQTVTATRTVNVVDTTAPTITLNGQTINLWPPNHSYHTINLTQFVTAASDGCDGGVDINDVVISKVTSDEPENDGGDGNTLNDIVIAANCKSVQLRSERQGNGNGRVYTIHFRVRDASGNTKTATAQVKVPKSQGNNGGAVDSGVQYTVNSGCP